MSGGGLPYQDTAYSWLVLAAASGLELLYAAGVGTIGVLIVQLSETFNVQKSALTWMGGLLLFSGFILGFIPSSLARKYGVRPVGLVASLLGCLSCVITSFAQNVFILYFSHGILASIAFCSFFNLASISGQQYFHRRRALASGVTMASISAGLLLWPPSCQALIDWYGWRGAFLLMGGIQLHGLVLSAIIRPIPVTKPTAQPAIQPTTQTSGAASETLIGEAAITESPDREREAEMNANSKEDVEMKDMKSIAQPDSCQVEAVSGVVEKVPCCTGPLGFVRTACSPVMSSPLYMGYLVGIFFIQTGHITAISMLPLRAHALNLNKTLGASLVSILGGTGGVARAAFGFVGDWSRLNRTLLVGASGLISGLLTCGMGYLTTYAQLAGVTALLGVTSAAYNALQGACVIDHVGRERLEPGVGLLSVSMGFGRLSALLISGVVLDLVGDPRYVFILFGLVEAVGGLIMPLIVLLKRRAEYYKNKRSHHQDMH